MEPEVTNMADEKIGPHLQDNGELEGLANMSEKEVISFLLENPDPTDQKVHAYAEEKGWDGHEFEAMIYRLATRYAQFRTGGESKGKRPKELMASEESMGQQVELEHTENQDDALKIAWDHLAEAPNSRYYTLLELVEKAIEAGPEHELHKKLMQLVEVYYDLESQH